MALLRSKSLWIVLLGRIVTNAGDNIYSVAIMWMIHLATGSTLYTGIAGFLTTLPDGLKFLFGPLVDKWSVKKRLFAVCDGLNKSIMGV